MSLTLWLELAPWASTVAVALAMMYYRSRALSAEAAVSDVAHADATADAELKASATTREAALVELAKAQQAAHVQDVATAHGATDAARVAELLHGSPSAGGGASSPVSGR